MILHLFQILKKLNFLKGAGVTIGEFGNEGSKDKVI
jgi:hypothetical protein